MPKIASRASWGARRPDGDKTLSGLAEDVFLHHSVTAQLSPDATVDQERAQMRLLEQIGYSRFGRYGQGISYNVVIFPSGRAYQGVSFNRRGAHTDGRNSVVRSLCFAGNYETATPTAAALKTAAEILADGAGKHWRKGYRVLGHRDIKATACPGKHVYAQIADIVADARRVSAPKPASRPQGGRPILAVGSRGRKVKALQRGLNAVFPAYRNASPVARGRLLVPDSVYGPHTRAWVRIFQEKVGLKVTGEVDSRTLAKLRSHGINL